MAHSSSDPVTRHCCPTLLRSLCHGVCHRLPLSQTPSVTPLPYGFRVVSATLEAKNEATMEEAHAALTVLRRFVRSADPQSVSGDEARRMVEFYAEIERIGASGVALFLPVVLETGSHAKAGYGSAADWLSAVSGTSAGAAKGRLAAARSAAATPVLTEALHEGELSPQQLEMVTKTAVEAPEATQELLGLVEQGASHQELSDAASRLRAGARRRETERVRRARVHAHRHVRVHQDEGGGIRGEFFCDEVVWAGVAPLIEARAKELWRAAGSKSGEPLEAYRLDAMIELLGSSDRSGRDSTTGAADTGTADTGTEGGPDTHGARPHTLVVIDAAALRRGTTEGDELCEIEGIGPISVEAAIELIGAGSLQFLVREGVDIRTVTKTTRVVAQLIDMALIVRDRTCARPGCGKRLGLERDHWQVDFHEDGPTELHNLVRLCPSCHDMKTNGGWRLTGGPGHWGWEPPPNPPSAGRIARNRKVAAAKGRARRSADRNKPRRT